MSTGSFSRCLPFRRWFLFWRGPAFFRGGARLSGGGRCRRGPGAGGFWGGLFVDHLADLAELLVQLHFGDFDSALAEVDGFGEQPAALLNSLGIAALFEFDATGAKELTEVFVKFVFIDRFHNGSIRR